MPLTPDRVLVIRHRAFNVKRAKGKGAVECVELLYDAIDADAIIELSAAWLAQRNERLQKGQRAARKTLTIVERMRARNRG